VIDQEATLSDSIILDHTYVGRLLNVQSKIVYKNLVIDIKTGEHITIKDQFMLAETEDGYVDIGVWRFFSSLLALVVFILLVPVFLLIALYLRIAGTTVFSTQECLHTDFRWFIPMEERRFRKFNLIHFQLQRKDGTDAPLGKWLQRLQLFCIPELINVTVEIWRSPASSRSIQRLSTG
jgi:hypothetical protein